MRDKIYSIVFSAIFIILLVWCPAAYFLDKADIIKIPENKNVKIPGKVYEGGGNFNFLLNSIEEGKANLENIYSNCLPMYENITVFMLNSERSMKEYLLETVYGFETAKPANTDPVALENNPGVDSENPDGEILITTETSQVKYKAKRIGTDWVNKVWAFAEEGQPYSEGWTDKTLLADEDELRRRIEVQTGHVNRIANANKDVNFYVFPCTRFQESEAFAEIIKDIHIMRNEFSTHDLMMEFFDKLDTSVINGYGYFDISTLEKRLERICKTDHHEAAQGAYSIYCDVINMMAEDSPVLGIPREATFDTIDGCELRGSHVWNFGYTEIYDDWWYYKIDLPEHTMYENINGRQRTSRQIDQYEAGRFSKDTFADHYYSYYPHIGNVEYPGNNTGRNLLLLGDSYSWATSELISSHFDHAYVTLWTHGRFDYDGFIKEHNITDVLILQVADRLLYDIQDDTQLDKVITD